jgi:hypothetical protein
MYQILKKKKKNGTGRKWVLEQTDRNGWLYNKRIYKGLSSQLPLMPLKN